MPYSISMTTIANPAQIESLKKDILMRACLNWSLRIDLISKFKLGKISALQLAELLGINTGELINHIKENGPERYFNTVNTNSDGFYAIASAHGIQTFFQEKTIQSKNETLKTWDEAILRFLQSI